MRIARQRPDCSTHLRRFVWVQPLRRQFCTQARLQRWQLLRGGNARRGQHLRRDVGSGTARGCAGCTGDMPVGLANTVAAAAEAAR